MSHRLVFPTLLFSLLSTSAMAEEVLFPSTGRATLSSTLSNYGIVGGDAMQPFYGNREGFLYGNLMADYSSDRSFVVSPGAGVRTIRSNQMFGARLFADYARTASRQKFLTISPGIEWKNSRWDMNANAYVPTKRSKRSGPIFSGGTTFQAGTHNQYNTTLSPYTVIGNGLDASVGYSFAGYQDLRSRLYGGGYVYDAPLNARNITGITAGVQLPLSDKLSLSFANSYDQVNKYTAGIKISFSVGAGNTTMSDDMYARAAEPVQRHIGIIDTGAGAIAQQVTKEESKTLQYSNVYFLSPTGTGNGTFGNAANLSQATLDLANAQNPTASRIYLQGGAGANYIVDSTTAAQSGNPNNDFGLSLYNNQDVFGRSADYKSAAAGNAQPTIQVDGANNYNGFILSGAQNTLSDLTLTTLAGFINGSTPTTSTGIIAYANGNQTINIVNTHVSGFADGMYAQNDSSTGTLTINATRSTFNNNGGDSGLNNIQVTGYNSYGASGLIAINNAGSSNALVINADQSEFNNNGTLSGNGSGINNNNFSVASGMTVIDNNDTGGVTVNATSSRFNNNGTLSGDNTYILASEAGPNASSINTAAATGLYARSNTSNSSALNINATNSTFNSNGLLSGDNSLIQAGGNSAGDNVNMANASGVFAFNNSSGSSSIHLASVNSAFNGNGILSGNGSNIFVLADNNSLGSVESSAVATGVFAFNNTTNAGSIAVDAMGSQFNNNGALSGDNAFIYARTTNVNNSNETVAANASGMFAYNANNQGSSNGEIAITADNSTFNGNGALSGNNTAIQSLNDNGFATGSASMAAATGLSVYNIAAGPLTVTATNSLFNTNAAFTGTGSNIVASGSDNNVFGSSGFFTLNNSGVSGNIFVNSLAGSGFAANGAGTTGFGIFGYTPSIIGVTSIDYTGASFSGAPQINTNQGISDGTTMWIQ